VTDFLAPAFEISVDGRPLTPERATQLAGLVVVNEPDSVDRFALTFANPFPDLPFTHGDAAKTFTEGSKVAIKLGYVDALETVAEGEVTAIGASFPADAAPTVRVEGLSPAHRLRGSVKTRTFQDVKDSDVAQQILSGAGVPLSVESTQVKHPYLIQYNETDLAFLSDRARRLRFVLAYEDGRLRFRASKESESRALLLVWGNPSRGINPAGDVYPLLSFDPTLRATRPVSKVVVRGLDPLTRKPIVGTASAGTESTGGSRKGPAVRKRAFGAATEAAVVDMPVVSRGEAEQIAKAIFDRLAMEFVTGTGRSPGLPGLRAGRVVELQGLGSFNGRYYVTRSTHSLSDEGYATSFSVRSDSVA
jgi:phage protein D